MGAPFEVILGDAVARERYGFDHPEASSIDLWTWVARGWLSPEPSVAVAAAMTGESLQFLPARAKASAVPTAWEDARTVARALEGERREEAEGRARALAAEDGERAILEALLPFVRKNLLDYGHGAIFTAKALEVVRAFPDLGEETVASLTSTLGWATFETALPTWTATREAVARSTMIDRVGSTPFDPQTRAAFEAQVLLGEKEAVHATLEAVARGIDVTGVLIAIGHAAAVAGPLRPRVVPAGRHEHHLPRRDPPHHVRPRDAGAVGGCAAGRERLARRPRGELRRQAEERGRPCRAAPRRVRRRPEGVAPGRGRARARARAREGDGRALRPRDAPRGLPRARALRRVRRRRAPHLPGAHIKTTEALYRMEIDDPREGGAYLDALVRFLANEQPERSFAKVANVAKQFLADGQAAPGAVLSCPWSRAESLRREAPERSPSSWPGAPTRGASGATTRTPSSSATSRGPRPRLRGMRPASTSRRAEAWSS